MLAIFAGLSATPTSAEACGDYSSFQTDEELVESAIRTHVYYSQAGGIPRPLPRYFD